MSWLRLEDNMLDHPKWRRALRDGGDEVFATWVRLVSWCSRHLTDGVVPADMVAEVAEVRSVERSRSIRALADAGLIEFSRGAESDLTALSRGADVIVTGYLERNPSREQVLTERSRRSESQRNRRVAAPEARLQRGTVPPCNEVPARPGPARPDPVPRERSGARAPEPPSSPTITEIRPIAAGGVSRVVSMPSAEPPKPYLDEALMRGIAPEQARSTWEHYWGAGLPERGVERLHDWLLKRAKERANSQARAGPRRVGTERSDVMAMMAEEIDRDRADEAERRERGKV